MFLDMHVGAAAHSIQCQYVAACVSLWVAHTHPYNLFEILYVTMRPAKADFYGTTQ
jgi:hypothetical protein